MPFLWFCVFASGCKYIVCRTCMLLCFQGCSKCRAYPATQARAGDPSSLLFTSVPGMLLRVAS